MRSWLKTSGAAIKAVVSSCSLLLVVGLALASPDQGSYAQLDEAIRNRDDVSARRYLTEHAEEYPALASSLPKNYLTTRDFGESRRAVHGLALSEQAVPQASTTSTDPAARARSVKSRNPLYHDGGEKESSSWLARAFERLGEAISRFFDRKTPTPPNLQAPSLGGQWIVYSMWGVLAVLLIAFLVFAISRFSWRKRLGRKVALLDDDEPERSLDEWLAMANQLEAEGRYREAVRCLYLACLLKFDEKLVARFDRGQTNWEHLSRIQASARRPAGTDFEPPTRAFDRVWYGNIVEGKADVDRFRAWYAAVVDQLATGAV